ncbi:MAG TPA: hypothetical protein VGA53_02490 [Candidatus Paceibacterota bacterium]
MKSGKYDLGIAWINPVEEQFVASVKKAARAKRLSLFEITYENVEDVFAKIENGELSFGTFFDRGSLDDATFFLMAEKLKAQGTKVVNDPAAVIQASSKAKLHEVYEQNGLPVPKTILLFAKTPKKELEEIPKKLGVPFVLKPSHGGAGEGVRLAAKNAKDIREFLAELALDKGLAQEYVVPIAISGKTAWFRPIYATGEIIPLWWDPANHFYREFGNSPKEKQIAKKLISYVQKIADLTKLDLFSCEIMIAEGNRYLVVDYANHPIDLSTQETNPDGLPPPVLSKIVNALIKNS